MEGNRPLVKAETLPDLLIRSAELILGEEERDVLTLFANPDVSEEDTEALEAWLAEHSPLTELSVVPTEDDFWKAVLTFE
jgi:dihydroxyacetone kinase-like predicted kinase